MGEHQEWSKYSNFEVSVNAPLMFYIPGVTASGEQRSAPFPYINPLSNRGIIKSNVVEKKVSNSKEIDHAIPLKYFESQKYRKFNITSEFAEFVDVFPTLSELAGLPTLPLCPINSSGTILCTEGTSLVPVIYRTIFNQSSSFQWKTAAFSQYPRPSDYPTENSDQPKLKDVKIVGYSMRTKKSRYTEWISFDSMFFQANWSDIHARELYLYDTDPLEMNNVAGLKKYSGIVTSLSKRLKLGWRGAVSQRS